MAEEQPRWAATSCAHGPKRSHPAAPDAWWKPTSSVLARSMKELGRVERAFVCNRGAYVVTAFLDLVGARPYDQVDDSPCGVTMNKLLITFAAAMLALPLSSPAQSLVDVARAEEARRKAITKPGKVYTNVDLRADITESRSMNVSPAEPAPSTEVPSLNLPGGKAEPLPPEKDPAYWSGRINAARQALDRSRIFADALQSRINALTTDFTNRDDPAQRAQLELERQRAMAELDRVNKEIAEQTKAIADIEDEARKAGVPPGWLR
jgi:hypothetical protein